MNVLLIFLIILILIIVIAILIDKSNIFKKPEPLTAKQISEEKQQAQNQNNTYLPYPTWSQPVPYDPNGTGACTIYTFLSNPYTPAVPSYTKLIDGTADYVIQPNNEFVCIDSDQIFASTISHECINPNGLAAGSGCILTVDTFVDGVGITGPGNFVPQGTIEGDPGITGNSLLYTPCNPNNLNNNRQNSSYCLGDIGLVIPNFATQGSYDGSSGTNDCLAGLWYQDNNGVNYIDTGIETCDLSSSKQIFRMIRYSVDSKGNVLQDDNGNLAAIVHRYTGYYLAPNAPLIKEETSDNVISYVYQSKSPFINYDVINDKEGNTYATSISLVLVNPKYDTIRNGVYWLLQNQTFNSSLDPQSTNFNEFVNNGVYYNQENYSLYYNSVVDNTNRPPLLGSHFFERTIEYCNGNTGATGCNGNNWPLELLVNNSSVGSCLFGIDLNSGGAPAVIPNVPIDLAPQQLVYIPDINLLPDPNTSAIWTYLINNFSINITSDDKPLLTPYRTTSKAELSYKCTRDPKDGNNYFTYLINYSDANNLNTVVNYKLNTTSDTQYIHYPLYQKQIQIGVSKNNPSTNVNFNSQSNPFNL